VHGGGQEHEHGASKPEKLGSVHFQTSCSARAQPAFDRAVALLHSFDFARAIDGFDATLKKEPNRFRAIAGAAKAAAAGGDRSRTPIFRAAAEDLRAG